MAQKSDIEWTDATWNPITGCSVLSPGCKHCYAMKLAGTRLRNHPSREGLTVDTKAGPVWTGEVRFNKEWLDQPLRWRRGRRVFVCAHADLFHESVPDDWIDQVFAVMALAPQHQFQVLTKRAERMQQYFLSRGRVANQAIGQAMHEIAAQRGIKDPCAGFQLPLRNVVLGVSAEDQKRADERIPYLQGTPAAARFLSLEPLLGFITLDCLVPRDVCGNCGDDQWPFGKCCDNPQILHIPAVDLVIVGGESSPNARPMNPAWARSLRDQCTAAGVPFMFKQWGSWAPDETAYLEPLQLYEHRWPTEPPTYSWNVGKKKAGRLLDGIEHNGSIAW